jgi:glycosyltransferase involved in cell wall biosynthesis
MARISVGIPVYNCERFVAQSIEAILAQTFTDFELVVSDNASTDGTEQICREYAARDTRIRYFRQPTNIGGPANFRYVFGVGRGEYQKWTTADDYWAPTFLDRAVRVLDQHPDVVLCYSKTQLIDIAGQPLEIYEDNLHLIEDSGRARFLTLMRIIGLCHADLGLIRRSAMQRTRLMTNERHCDVHFVAELALYGKFWLLPEPLFYRRKHVGSSSWDLNDETRQRNYYDPARIDRFGLHTWRKYARLSGAVLRSPIPAGDKASLLATIGRWMAWDRSQLWQDLATLGGVHRAARPVE